MSDTAANPQWSTENETPPRADVANSRASDGPGRAGKLRLPTALALTVVISLAGMGTIVALIHHADAKRSAQLKLDDIATNIGSLQNAPWRILTYSAESNRQVLSQSKSLKQQIRRQLAELELNDPTPELGRLKNQLSVNFQILARETSLLTADRTAAATRLEALRFRNQDELDATLNKANLAYHDAADRSERWAAIGSAFIVLVLLGGFLTFYRRAFLARHAAEALALDLADTQRHLEEAQRQAAVGSWEFDLGDQTLVCSPENARLHGWDQTKAPATAQELIRAIATEDRERVLAVLTGATTPGTEVRADYRVQRDGEERLIHLGAQVVVDDKGRLRLVGTCQDVTDRLRRVEAERANQAHAEFMSRMNHDLRTPLNAILGFGQLLATTDLSERDSQNARRIVEAGQHLLGLVDQMLDPAYAQTPAVDPAGFAPDPTSGELAAGRPDGLRVLCVDDNPANLVLIDHVISLRADVELITASTGEEALELALEVDPVAVLLDLNLPGIGGEEVLTRLKTDPRTHQVPVVVLSADSTSESVAALLAAGAHCYLHKPLDVSELLRVLDDIFASRVIVQR